MGGPHSLDSAFMDQRGSVLLGGLLLVLAVTLIGVGLFQATVIESRQVGSTAADVRAFYAAESGLNRAALDTAYDNTYVQGSYTFDSVKGSLPNDNTTPVTLSPSRAARSPTSRRTRKTCSSPRPTATTLARPTPGSL